MFSKLWALIPYRLEIKEVLLDICRERFSFLTLPKHCKVRRKEDRKERRIVMKDREVKELGGPTALLFNI